MKKLGETYDPKGQELQEQYTDICNGLRDIRDYIVDFGEDLCELETTRKFLKQLRKDTKYLLRLLEEQIYTHGGN